MPNFRFAILKRLAPAALALALVVGPAGGVHATPGQIHVVESAVVSLRAGPSTKAQVIGRLARGDRVMEFELRGRWLRVQQMGTVAPEGWVHAALVAHEVLPPAAQAEPQPEYAPRRPVRWRYADDYYVLYPTFHRRHLRRHKKRTNRRHLRRHKGRTRVVRPRSVRGRRADPRP
jgi:hypothetical protein